MRTNDCLSSDWIKKISLDEMHSCKKYKTWSDVSFWMPNISSLILVRIIFHMAIQYKQCTWHILVRRWLKSYKGHRSYNLQVNIVCFQPLTPFHVCCNWWIHSLMHLVFLLHNSPYVIVTSSYTQVMSTIFVFCLYLLFQVDKSSCCLTNSCSC